VSAPFRFPGVEITLYSSARALVDYLSPEISPIQVDQDNPDHFLFVIDHESLVARSLSVEYLPSPRVDLN